MGYYTKFDINRNQEDVVLAIEEKSGLTQEWTLRLLT